MICIYYLGCFQFLAIMKNAAKISPDTFSRGHMFLFFASEGKYLEVGLLIRELLIFEEKECDSTRTEL